MGRRRLPATITHLLLFYHHHSHLKWDTAPSAAICRYFSNICSLYSPLCGTFIHSMSNFTLFKGDLMFVCITIHLYVWHLILWLCIFYVHHNLSLLEMIMSSINSSDAGSPLYTALHVKTNDSYILSVGLGSATSGFFPLVISKRRRLSRTRQQTSDSNNSCKDNHTSSAAQFPTLPNVCKPALTKPTLAICYNNNVIWGFPSSSALTYLWKAVDKVNVVTVC